MCFLSRYLTDYVFFITTRAMYQKSRSPGTEQWLSVYGIKGIVWFYGVVISICSVPLSMKGLLYLIPNLNKIVGTNTNKKSLYVMAARSSRTCAGSTPPPPALRIVAFVWSVCAAHLVYQNIVMSSHTRPAVPDAAAHTRSLRLAQNVLVVGG